MTAYGCIYLLCFILETILVTISYIDCSVILEWGVQTLHVCLCHYCAAIAYRNISLVISWEYNLLKAVHDQHYAQHDLEEEYAPAVKDFTFI